jgi:hypothetical protein
VNKGFFAIGNDELINKPTIKEGDMIVCPKCHKQHKIVLGTNMDTGKKSNTLQYYKCGKDTYLAGINGKCIIPHN